MSDHPEHRDGFVHPSVNYEPTDLSLRAVIWFSLGLVVVLAAVSAGVYFMIPAAVGPPPARPQPVSPWAFGPEPSPNPNASYLPAKPELEAMDQNRQPSRGGRVQSVPIREQVQDEEARLNSYGETEEKGIAHIPIEEAMKRMAAGAPGGKP